MVRVMEGLGCRRPIYEVPRGMPPPPAMFLQWYAVDFGSSQAERLQYCLPFLPAPAAADLRALLDDGKYSVQYAEYDWGINSVD